VASSPYSAAWEFDDSTGALSPAPNFSSLKYRIAFRPLCRYPSQGGRFLRRYPKIPRRLKRTPDIGILRAAIEGNQLHAVRALHLIAVPESSRSLAERFAAFGTQDHYPVRHEILQAVRRAHARKVEPLGQVGGYF
jgi:hypothetical protein